MENSQFVSADTSKITEFEKQSAEAIKEFADIKSEFKRINQNLLSSWKGAGANAYKNETDHILEKIGSVEDVLKTINEGAVKSIYDSYSNLDEELVNLTEIQAQTRSNHMPDLTGAQYVADEIVKTVNVPLEILTEDNPNTIFNIAIMEYDKDETNVK